MRRVASFALAFTFVGQAAAQVAYTDTHGREWRQVAGIVGRTWHQVAQVCPTDGLAPCAGALGGADLTGWTWATQQQVLGLFAEFAPGILKSGSVSGPAYTMAGLGFMGVFEPTWEAYTVVGGFFHVSGWSATRDGPDAVAPAVSAQYNPHDAAFSALALAPADSASAYRGVWLHRTPDAGCPADLNGNGLLNFFDVDRFMDLYAQGDPAADLAAPFGVFNFFDVSAYAATYAAGCP